MITIDGHQMEVDGMMIDGQRISLDGTPIGYLYTTDDEYLVNLGTVRYNHPRESWASAQECVEHVHTTYMQECEATKPSEHFKPTGPYTWECEILDDLRLDLTWDDDCDATLSIYGEPFAMQSQVPSPEEALAFGEAQLRRLAEAFKI